MKVRDVMTTDVETVRPETPFKELVELMLKRDVSGLPVVDATGQVVGMVTEADLISKQAYATGRRHRALRCLASYFAGQNPVWVKRAEGLTAAEVMSQPVITVGPDAELRDVARTMLAHHVKRLPVAVDGRLVGLVSRPDLMRFFDRADLDIASEIDELLADPRRAPEEHHVITAVDEGIVTLTGTVRYPSDAGVIARLVSRVGGVVDVRDELIARHPEPKLENIDVPLVP